MKTVGDFKKAGVVFVDGDEGNDFYIINPVSFNNDGVFDYDEVTSFAWRDLTTKPDNPDFKIELDVDNHRWRPSLNQGVEHPYEQRVSTAQVKQPEFKVGDLVITDFHSRSELMLLPDATGTVILKTENGNYVGTAYHCLKHYNPELDELKDIIGTHDDPTECAKAILAAGYKK